MHLNIRNLSKYSSWVNKFGSDDMEWLADQIASQIDEDEYECADNFRLSHIICRLSDIMELVISIEDNCGKVITVDEEYADSRDHGCCGFKDIQFGPAPSGQMYVFGFNYGH